MRQVETDWWTMDLPNEWRARQDEASVVITDTDEVGDISITTLQPASGDAGHKELKQLVTDAQLTFDDGKPVSVGSFDGRYFEFEEDGEFVREWYLAAGGILLLISYCCDPDNRDMDREVVDQILGTLELKTEPGSTP